MLACACNIPLSDLEVVCERIKADTTVFKTGVSDTPLEHKRIRWRAKVSVSCDSMTAMRISALRALRILRYSLNERMIVFSWLAILMLP